MMQNMYTAMGISPEVYEYGEQTLVSLKDRFDEIDKTAEYNQLKVLKAMQDCRVSEACLLGTTGYGYNDIGRDTLEAVYASLFHTEAALVRPQITCGTHALALALMSNLRPGDELLSPVGKPYDTLEEVIGIRESRGSLKEYGISYRQVDLKEDGSFDWEGIRNAIHPNTKLATIQRSKGYQTRPTLSVEQIGELIAFLKSIKPDIICMVDNCYGEFTDVVEPLCAGADIIAGSLIKNPGGGIAPTGGYIAGKAKYIQRIENLLTVPGMGREVGSYAASYRPFYQGLYMAPHTTAQALKGAALFARVFEMLGMETMPSSNAKRSDIVQAVRFEEADGLISFCRSIQSASPVDSAAVPEPWDMPGYTSQVIMAAGAFVQGSSIELSADAPIRKPYTAYVQGGLTYEHCSLAAMLVLTDLIKKGIAKL